MRSIPIAALVTLLFVAGCAPSANQESGPLAPSAVTSAAHGQEAEPLDRVGLPFHSEVTWQKVEGTQISLCTQAPPEGKIYLARNTQTGTAVSTHLGTGTFEGHTCVYGTRAGGPEGWLGDVRWTAANGDVLLATSRFLRWTGTPGKSVAEEAVTFQSGGTGRFRFAKGQAMCYVNAPGRTATYEGSVRYAKEFDEGRLDGEHGK